MIFAANFKMNHTRSSTAGYMEKLGRMLDESGYDDRIYIFPPSTALCPSSASVTVGAQNAYMADHGAYTVEIGLEQLEEFGIRTILIGHSERRQLLGEDQNFIAEKIRYYSEREFEIIYCIGEPTEVRDEGTDGIFGYLWNQFDGIDLDYGKLIVAYEPIWAIGTGRSARTGEISEVHGELRKRIGVPLLYGGSVNADNISQIAAVTDVDGVLVGSASLKPDSFFSLVKGIDRESC